jgi:hypothetical protein
VLGDRRAPVRRPRPSRPRYPGPSPPRVGTANRPSWPWSCPRPRCPRAGATAGSRSTAVPLARPGTRHRPTPARCWSRWRGRSARASTRRSRAPWAPPRRLRRPGGTPPGPARSWPRPVRRSAGSSDRGSPAPAPGHHVRSGVATRSAAQRSPAGQGSPRGAAPGHGPRTPRRPPRLKVVTSCPRPNASSTMARPTNRVPPSTSSLMGEGYKRERFGRRTAGVVEYARES